MTDSTDPASTCAERASTVTHRHGRVMADLLRVAVHNRISGSALARGGDPSGANGESKCPGLNSEVGQSAAAAAANMMLKRGVSAQASVDWTREGSDNSIDSCMSSLTSGSSARSLIQINHGASLQDWHPSQLKELRLRAEQCALEQQKEEEAGPELTYMTRHYSVGRSASDWGLVPAGVVTEGFEANYRRPNSVDSAHIGRRLRGYQFRGITSFFRRRTAQVVPADVAMMRGSNNNTQSAEEQRGMFSIKRFSSL